jgi:3-ketosteroid 9alpha-monooxygenase subunit A
MKNWPYKSFPTGWFQIGWSARLEPGEVKPLHLFDQELVLYRTEQGVANLVDAACPHLGGHLGRGGCVKGENIQCPWHGWEWDLDGRNAHIPFADQVHRKHPTIRVKSWPVREISGIIITWYDSEGREPTWEWPGVPEFDDPENFYHPVPHGIHQLGPFPIQPQSIVENAADPQHFYFVHGAGGPASIKEFESNGHHLRAVLNLTFGAEKEATWLTPDGPTVGELETNNWGLGLGLARFKVAGFVAPQIVAGTPIDHEQTYVFSSVGATRLPGDPDVPGGRAAKMMALQHEQITRDCEIWRYQEYIRKPLSLHETEQYMVPVRRWADQFYPDPMYRGRFSEIKHVPEPEEAVA